MTRKKTPATDPLAETFRDAFQLMDRQKADGVPLSQRVKGLEAVLRDKLLVREWKYLCDTCSDYGLDMRQCPGDLTCGRTFPHLPHDFGVPCTCPAGLKFRPKTLPPPPEPKHYADAGKEETPLAPVGRWKKREL